MSPFSLGHILHQVIQDAASRMALAAREAGKAADIPTSYYIERIADRLGITKRQLYRYMEGSTSPAVTTITRICEICESTLPVEWQCREVGLGFYRRVKSAGADRKDVVSLVAAQLKEGSEAAQCSLKYFEDDEISVNEYRALEQELDQAADAITATKSALRAKMEAGLRR